MNKFRTSSKCILLFLLFHASILGQSLQELQLRHSGFPEVILKKGQKMKILIERDSLNIQNNYFYESLILNERGIQDNSESFVHSDLVQLKSSGGWSVVSLNGKERKLEATHIVDMPYKSSNYFNDDLKTRKMTFSGLHVGARKLFNYTVKIKDPFLLNRYIFGSHLPTEEESLEVSVDKKLDFDFHIVNDPEKNIQYERKEERKVIRHIWTANKISAYTFEESNPGILHIVPHIVLFIRSYQGKNSHITVLGSVPRLHHYYRNFVDHLNDSSDPALNAFTLELVKDATSDVERMKAIYYWVKSNIAYIAFESGYEGFIPREAAEVFKRRFGDCKDYSSLLSAMASYAGIQNVHLCWIGTREIPYSYSDLATPSVDNHMIAVMKKDQQYFWMDGTDLHTSFGMPSAFIQGKEALISLGDTFEVVQVPIVLPHENLLFENLDLSLNGGSIEGKGRISFTGLVRAEALSQIYSGITEDRRMEIKDLLTQGNDKFRLDDFIEENANDRDKPYHLQYAFHLDKHVVSTQKALYLSLFMKQPFLDSRIQPQRKSSYDLKMLVSQINNTRLKIPEGYKIEALPSDFNLENELIMAEVSYSMEGNDVVLQWEIINKTIIIEPENFQLWNDTIDRLKEIYSKTLTLSKL